MSSIPLSPKHGVNPTIPVCFFCGKTKNQVAFLGRIGGKKDLEAPRECIIDYEPCDECKQAMSQGVTVIEVTTSNDNNIPPMTIAENGTHWYPTGRWTVVKPEAFKDNKFKAGSKTCCDTKSFEELFGGIFEKQKDDAMLS